MRKQLAFCFAIILLLAINNLAQSKIGNIKNTNVVEGCSCSLQMRKTSNRYVFLSDYEKRSAWMNIDGRDIKLSFVSTTEKRRATRPARKGDRFTDRWSGGGVEVKIDYVVTAPMTRDKEYVDYGVTITITKNGKTQIAKASGNCGC
jgi:hypothetical protein